MLRRRLLTSAAVVVALIGALLVFVYARGADARAEKGATDTSSVLVVSKAITAGESADSLFSSGKVRVESLPSSTLVQGSTDDSSSFTGKVALTDLYPGEQLLPQKFGSSEDVATKPIIDVPDGYLTFTIDLADVNHVGPFLQPGQHVALWVVPAQAPSDSGGDTVKYDAAKVLVPNVEVVSVGSEIPAAQTADGQSDGSTIASDAPTTTIGIAAPPKQVSIIGGAAFAGGQTMFMTLLNGKTRLKTDASFLQGN